jgi:hypothetical protein
MRGQPLQQAPKPKPALPKLFDPDNDGPMTVDMTNEAAGYKVPAGEEKYVHIRMYIGARYDANTGEEIANYTIQKFNVIDFKNFEKQAPRLGYRYGFLHKPKGFKSVFSKN